MTATSDKQKVDALLARAEALGVLPFRTAMDARGQLFEALAHFRERLGSAVDDHPVSILYHPRLAAVMDGTYKKVVPTGGISDQVVQAASVNVLHWSSPHLEPGSVCYVLGDVTLGDGLAVVIVHGNGND
jgi:hypothetical protein